MNTLEERRVALVGWGVNCAYAKQVDELIGGLEEGRRSHGLPWFANETDCENLRLSVNPWYVPFPEQQENRFILSHKAIFDYICNVIDQALAMAGITAEALSGERVRIYIPGNGLRANHLDVAGYQDRNDPEDLQFFPRIKQLHANSYSQDKLMHQLGQHYGLAWPPIGIFCASNSSMAALHLAQAAIRSDEADIAIIAGWLDTTLQDVVFLGGQSLLGSGEAQPFSKNGNSVLPGNGAASLLIGSEAFVCSQGREPDIYLNSSVSYQSSGARGGNSFSADFRSIANTLETALEEAGIVPESVSCIFPHGNGIQSSDKAESMAIRKIWGDNAIPVVSYKGQISYLSTCSALVDLMIAADALRQQRLLAFLAPQDLDDSLNLALHANAPPLALQGKHIVKSSLGLEGSVFACVISYEEQQS